MDIEEISQVTLRDKIISRANVAELARQLRVSLDDALLGSSRLAFLHNGQAQKQARFRMRRKEYICKRDVSHMRQILSDTSFAKFESCNPGTQPIVHHSSPINELWPEVVRNVDSSPQPFESDCSDIDLTSMMNIQIAHLNGKGTEECPSKAMQFSEEDDYHTYFTSLFSPLASTFDSLDIESSLILSSAKYLPKLSPTEI